MAGNPNADSSAALPSSRLVWGSTIWVLLIAGVAVLIFISTDPDLHLNLDSFVVLAPIFFAAQALERLLEPFTSIYNPPAEQEANVKDAREQKLRAESAVAAQITAAPTAVESAAAVPSDLKETLEQATDNEKAAQLALRKKRAERKIWWWAVATTISLLLCGVLGLGILEAMSTVKLKEYLGAIDVVLTGFVIGAGTKPLHDLISRLEKAKDNANPATTPTAGGSAASGAAPTAE